MNGGKPVPKQIRRRVMAVAALFCLLLLVSGCQNTEEPLTEHAEPEAPTPTQKLDRFATQHTEGGILKWTLVGEASTLHHDTIHVENPTVEIFENGEVAMTLTSNKGVQFLTGTEKDNLHLSGDVVGVSKDGKLYTEELHWKNRAGILYAPNEATVVRGTSTWHGTEMRADPTLETVKMKNNRFQLYPGDEEIHETHPHPK